MTKKGKEDYAEIKEGVKALSKLIKGPTLDEAIDKEKKIKQLADAMKEAEASKAYIKAYKDKVKADRRERVKKLLGIK